MTMPKTAMDEDGGPIPTQKQIWLAGQTTWMQPISETLREKRFSYC
jgi:hypothetical protein